MILADNLLMPMELTNSIFNVASCSTRPRVVMVNARPSCEGAFGCVRKTHVETSWNPKQTFYVYKRNAT